jgi:biopolymer transport protein ExbD
MCDINTTPLIDVMLVLLVTLIISLPVMTHAVKLDMPNPNAQPPPPDTPPEVIDLEIDFDGTVAWNAVASMALLEDYFRMRRRIPAEIHLRPTGGQSTMRCGARGSAYACRGRLRERRDSALIKAMKIL